MSSEDFSGEDKRGRSRRSFRTPGLRNSDSDRVSDDGDLDESDKAEWSEEERGTKVSILMCPSCRLNILLSDCLTV